MGSSFGDLGTIDPLLRSGKFAEECSSGKTKLMLETSGLWEPDEPRFIPEHSTQAFYELPSCSESSRNFLPTKSWRPRVPALGLM
jgi:hypothetical protein